MSYNHNPNYRGRGGNRGGGAQNFSSPFGPGPATNTDSGNYGYQNNQGYHNQNPRGGSDYSNSPRGGYGGYRGNRGGGGYDNNRRGGWVPRGGDRENRGRGRGWVQRGGRGNDRGGGNNSGFHKRPDVNSANIDAKEYLMPQMWGNPWAKLEAEYQKEYGIEPTTIAN